MREGGQMPWRDLSAYQPYYAAWLAVTGGGPTWAFLAWIGARWREFDRREGRDPDASLPRLDGERDRFGRWLAAVAGLDAATAAEIAQ